MHPEHVSVLVPVYRNAETLTLLYHEVRSALAEIGVSARFIFVDDAGCDGSLEILCTLAKDDPEMVLVQNHINLGQQAAIRKGLAKVGAQDVVVIDADLQDPPEAIPVLLERLWSSGADAVFASRVGRYQSGFRMMISRIYRALYTRFAALPRGAGGFVVLRREVVARLVQSNNRRFHLAGMIGCHAAHIEAIDIPRNYRQFGSSAYSERMRLMTALSNFVCVFGERFRHGPS